MTAIDIHQGDDEAARWRRSWELDDDVAYLNHGSVGLSPTPVLDAWTGWIHRIDRQRLGFFRREAEGALAEARERLGAFVGTTGDTLAFVTNATMAMLAIARGFPLEPGDEVLTSDHEYWSVNEIWQRVCREAGAKLVVRKLPVPLPNRDKIVDELLGGVTSRTRLVIFSHITYRTSVILPVEALCRRAREMGVAVCVDGAHALAQLPLDIDALDCDYYVASCHKWLLAPAGTGFLYVHPRARDTIAPLTGVLKGDWRDGAVMGTQDFSRFLAVPAAIDFMESAGLDGFRRRSHALAAYARERISELTGLRPWFEDSPDWYGSMIALPLPPVNDREIQDALWRDFQIESYVKNWLDRSLIRVSCHLYTQAAEIDRLVDALRALGISG